MAYYISFYSLSFFLLIYLKLGRTKYNAKANGYRYGHHSTRKINYIKNVYKWPGDNQWHEEVMARKGDEQRSHETMKLSHTVKVLIEAGTLIQAGYPIEAGYGLPWYF